MKAKELFGCYTAMVTPFDSSGEIDWQSLSDLVEYQIKAGVEGLVLCGSTAEAALLSEDEYSRIIKTVKKQVGTRVKLVGSIGASNTRRAIETALFLTEMGMDAIMVVAPPYVKPSQDGIYNHFLEIKKKTFLPLIAYNVPGRTAVSILPQTIRRLSEENLIIGLKDATGSLDYFLDTLSLCQEQISLLSGECSLVHSLMSSGASGTISASANFFPSEFARLTFLARSGDFAQSLKIQLELLPAIRFFFSETNPVPVKAALAYKSVIKSPTVRLPLSPLSQAGISVMREVLS
jgi:4-hydroxy-tetrahydrodipicolinate synthase